MGTDIHMVAQVKVDVTWLGYDELLAYDLSAKYEDMTVGDGCGYLWETLKKRFWGYDPANCRIVFGFDS